MRAALKGINYAAQNLDEAVQIVLKYAGPETNPAHMKAMLLAELTDASTPNDIGWQSIEQWQALADMLAQYNALPAGVDVSAAFDTSVWQAAQK